MACLVFSLNEMPCGVYILMTRVASTNIIHGRNRKNMRRTLIVSWAVAVALCASAQKPQEIKGIVEEAHDSLWYAGQVEAWQREVDADGQDEKAWRNLFEAAWGLKSCSRGKNDGGMPRILERMERAIPETYTYNICAYRASQGPDNKFAEKAMTLLPDDISDRGYDAVLGYLWMMGETDGTGWKAGLFNDILRRQYEHGKYPSFILRFGYNQLQGMAEGGLFFGNGDAELFDKLMLQRAMRVHTDKVVVVIPFLSIRSYRDALCRQLGIPPFPGREVRTEEEFKAASAEAAGDAQPSETEKKAAAPAEESNVDFTHEAEISYDDFCKVELRVAEVRACENLKESKKLLHLTVFDGERERCILSGIAKWFKPEDLIGKKIGIVCNLAPRPMLKGKYVSEGMIFAADTADGGCSIAFYGDDTPVGSRIH